MRQHIQTTHVMAAIILLTILSCTKANQNPQVQQQLNTVSSDNALRTVRLNILATPQQLAADPTFRLFCYTIHPAVIAAYNSIILTGRIITYPVGSDGILNYSDLQTYSYWTRLGLKDYNACITYFANCQKSSNYIYWKYSDNNDFVTAYNYVIYGQAISAKELDIDSPCYRHAMWGFILSTCFCGGLAVVPVAGEVLAGTCMVGTLGQYNDDMNACHSEKR